MQEFHIKVSSVSPLAFFSYEQVTAQNSIAY